MHEEPIKTEGLNRLPLGVGANPIEPAVIDACGDCDLWDELDELLGAQVGSV